MSNPSGRTPVTLTFGGDLTISCAAANREKFREVCRSGAEAFIRVEGEVDLSFIQLLCSAHRTFSDAGRALSIAGNLPDSLRKLLADSGITEFSCGSNERQCFWKREGA